MSAVWEAAGPESPGPASAPKALRWWRLAWLAVLLILLGLLALVDSEIQREQNIARLEAAIAGMERCSFQRNSQDLFRFLTWKRILQHCWRSLIRTGDPGFQQPCRCMVLPSMMRGSPGTRRPFAAFGD